MRLPLCQNNHPMSFIPYQKLIVVNEDYIRGCSCDWCHRQIGINDTVCHCNICNYDVCVECIKHGKPHNQIDHIHGINSHALRTYPEHCFSIN